MNGPVWLAGISSCLLGYLLGSLNFAVIISKCFYRKDIRKFGSGNAGMTNMLRTFGKKAAAFTLLGDIGKGVAAVLLARVLYQYIGHTQSVYGAFLAAIFAMLGHLFPIYFHFKGGKGVAVAAGTIIAVEPWIVLPLFVVFMITVFTSKMVSLSSILCAALYPFIVFVYYHFFETTSNAWICTLLAAVMSVVVIFMHRENIKRLANGTEYKFGQKKKEQETVKTKEKKQ